MNILITSGGTTEKIDAVRSITNKSTGKLGALIAEAFAMKKPAAEIHYICSPEAIKPRSGNIHLYKEVGVADVHSRLLSLVNSIPFDIIVHAMAISDYALDRVTNVEILAECLGHLDSHDYETIYRAIDTVQDTDMQGMKKIDSSQDSLILILKKTPKLIGCIREAQPNCVLVGFKLLVDVSREILLDAAFGLLEKNSCNAVFANDLVDIHDADAHKGILVMTDKSFVETRSKIEAAEAITSYTLALSMSERERG